MTVVVMATKSDSFTVAGTTKRYEDITRIVDKGEVVELIGKNKHRATITKTHNIIADIVF